MKGLTKSQFETEYPASFIKDLPWNIIFASDKGNVKIELVDNSELLKVADLVLKLFRENGIRCRRYEKRY